MPADDLTNRDLYLAVRADGVLHQGVGRTLEEYLRALWQLGQPLRYQASLSGRELLRLLVDAWAAPVPPFDEAWRAVPRADREDEGFAGWEQQILGQIRDQREMAEAGMFDNDYIYFGVAAPHGALWFNFHPASFLEAAAEGTFGGWQPDDGGRMLVPGPVAVIGLDGAITSVDASEIDRPVEPLGEIGWERFAEFLYWGQVYE